MRVRVCGVKQLKNRDYEFKNKGVHRKDWREKGENSAVIFEFQNLF